MRKPDLKPFAASAVLMWTTGQAIAEDIQAFVKKTYVHGVPYEEAAKYDASAVPTLLKILGDPGERNHWSNALITLGMIGDESAVEPMIAFIEESGKGKMDQTRRMARTSAFMALGYLINETGNRRALEYLISYLKPDPAGKKQPGRSLMKYAIIGLGLSGHPEAAAALKSMKSSRAAMPAGTTDMIGEALDTNQRVKEKGLADYYREP